MVEPLVGSGADVLLGALADPDLGQVMAIGLGGRRAGLGRDVAYRLLPFTDVDARELIDAAETRVRSSSTASAALSPWTVWRCKS